MYLNSLQENKITVKSLRKSIIVYHAGLYSANKTHDHTFTNFSKIVTNTYFRLTVDLFVVLLNIRVVELFQQYKMYSKELYIHVL